MTLSLVRQIMVIAATAAMLYVNGMANSKPLNGVTTGGISNQFKVYFVPAGYVFSIWGIIYLLLIAFSIYQALPAQRGIEALDTAGWLYVVGSLANIAWLYLWHYQRFPLTLVAMFSLLGSLIATYLVLDIGRGAPGAGMRWLVHLPFSVYLGWITVATIANVTTTLEAANWSGWGITAQTWAVIMIAIAGVVTIAVTVTRVDIAYTAVIVWALAGIAAKHSEVKPVNTASWVAAGAVIVSLVVMLIIGGGTKA